MTGAWEAVVAEKNKMAIEGEGKGVAPECVYFLGLENGLIDYSGMLGDEDTTDLLPTSKCFHTGE